jgi:3-deoxy-D-manno-octulosonate 8-phosphate phosphatase (KDO 8-P phosphatase)
LLSLENEFSCLDAPASCTLPFASRLQWHTTPPFAYTQNSTNAPSQKTKKETNVPSPKKISPALKKRAAQIKLLLMDVDGTLTAGGVAFLSQPDGSALEIKTFDAHDGQGLTLAHTAGLRTGCITGRESPALLRRANEMKMEFIYMKRALKMPAYEEILAKAGVADSAVAYVGDDLPDIPLMRRVGLAVAVGDAVPEVKRAAHYTTLALAGHGAIREAVELILKSQGIWEEMIDKARA